MSEAFEIFAERILRQRAPADTKKIQAKRCAAIGSRGTQSPLLMDPAKIRKVIRDRAERPARAVRDKAAELVARGMQPETAMQCAENEVGQ